MIRPELVAGVHPAGLGPQLHDREVAGVVDEDGRLGEFVGGRDQARIVVAGLGQEALAQESSC
jgi:hypothetical protein